jgi:hydrocephalus-inducing protein
MPDLQISNDIVEFGDVKCGECKIITVQLHNHKEVRCDWSAAYLPKKDEKFTPLHLKRKKRVEGEPNKPRTFEIIPPSGILMPSQKVNIQLKFMPTEEKQHEERVTIRMAQSSQRLMVLCKGKGLEPRIELSKNSIEFEPILPHGAGDEQEIKIVNPCNFPIEIYNLEFDKNYLEEEKILRIIRGYDEYNTILLPPRPTGDKLPNELYDYFEEQLKKLEEEEKKQKQILSDQIENIEGGGGDNTARQPMASAGTEKTKSKSDDLGNAKVPVGDVDKNPVFDSIARYLGIDLSSEGKAARNRRGVAMIIHGPPLSGKSRAAVALAKHYECALLTIDSIITDAISSSTSPSAAKARQLCAETAAKYAEEARAQEAIEQSKMNLNAAGTQSIVNGQSGGLSVEALAQHSMSRKYFFLLKAIINRLYTHFIFIEGGLQGGSKKTSVAGDSHSNVKLAKKGKAENSNVDQSSTHVSFI